METSFSRSRYPVGLDISDSSIKFVQLKKKREKISIQSYGKVDLPDGLIRDGEIKDEKTLVSLIKAALQSPIYGEITFNEAVSCLPNSKTFIKLIEIETGTNHLNDVIFSEMEKYIPSDLSRFYLDWQIIEKTKNLEKVLIGASPINIAEQYTSAMKSAQLTPIALELEPVSICRSLLAEEGVSFGKGQGNNYLIMNIASKYGSITAYSKNTILFDISFPSSGEKMTKSIANTLDINLEQAERAKIICGLDSEIGNGAIKIALSDDIEAIKNRLIDAINFYQNNHSERGLIKNIILTGGGAFMSGLKEYINRETSIETIIGNPLAHISQLDRDKESQTLLGPDYSTAIGLSLRGVFIDKF
jgi:type IV pilus assembly protein PilM